ncbi:hypothetical protein GCM10022243_48220 [Saccharothrix violaceirubra]|uniref:Major capsid protein E n=1 Tax=Saccharothrix violaceirubra TaxID=413306 RepID=A0A7W7T018_9PSEU|nr:major capsid protein [Saccharothrix violaceirubra]MBB4963836.1 hypothetical protein [Saccharothrix violaceirubra]
MAIVFDGPVSPDAVTSFIRLVPATTGFILNELLPDKEFQDIEVDFEELVLTNRVARFRSYDGRVHVSQRDGMRSGKVRLPPVSSSLNMGEYERLLLEFERIGGTRTDALKQAIYNDALRLVREVRNRMELARGDVLTDFKLSMLAGGNEPAGLEADYGAPAGHLVAPSTLWSNTTTATPLSDLVAWCDRWKTDNGGAGAGALWTSNRVLRLAQRNKEIIDAVYGATQGRTRVTVEELNNLLESEGIPTIRTYDASVDVDGVTTPIIPDDRLLIAPANGEELGFTAWGISATALELVRSNEAEMNFAIAPGVVGLVVKEGPPFREFTYVDAVGMPVISNPRALIVADVL